MDQRKDYISWDEYFMSIAKLTALRSKDPNSQVGACIVGKDNRIISCGYNGAPNGFNDNDFPWKREGNPLNTKYMYVCHSELNAILNYRGYSKDFEGAKIYVTLFPCNDCAKAIIQAGIKTVIYACDKYNGTEMNMAAKKLFSECGVDYVKFDSNREININLKYSDKAD